MHEKLTKSEPSGRNIALERVMEGGNRFSHVAFFPGGSILEPMTSLYFRLTQGHQIKKLKDRPGEFPVTRNVFKGNMGRFFREIEEAKLNLRGIDILDEYYRPDFKVVDYGQMVDKKMSELAEKGELEIVIANSVGTLSTLWAVAMRIKRAREKGHDPYNPESPAAFRLPKMLILVDPLFDGLTTVAETYIKLIRQIYSLKTVPGLDDLFPNSYFLNDLKNLIEEVREDLPLTITLNSQVGKGKIASPFAAVDKIDFDPIAEKLGIREKIEEELLINENGNDGMCKEGMVKDLWPDDRWFELRRLGGLHVEGPHVFTKEIMEILTEKKLKGHSLSEFPMLTKDELTIDDSNKLNSKKSRRLGKLMISLFKMLIKKSNPLGD